MIRMSLKACLVIAALFGSVSVGSAAPNCPSKVHTVLWEDGFRQCLKKVGQLGRLDRYFIKVARFLGDVNAVKRGAIGMRVTNRLVGKASTRISRGISKGIVNFFK